ncbi:RDD family protein [Carnobacterium funditum]|uniref:RDD family protein n=1 Tax=Carnobacterium funditum TaxID=2752 RepID=UPI000A51088B|nr:RDD family protein [Carnobacterium funditum]
MDNNFKSTEKGTTKELDLSELKQFLAKEEEDSNRKKRLIQLDKENGKQVEQLDNEEEIEKEIKVRTPEELRNERRLYWQEQQKQQQVEKTPFNFYPSYFYGGFWFRLFAYLIDLLVIESLNRLIVSSYFIITKTPMRTEFFSLFSISQLGLFLLYFILITKLTNGQTIGKMIFGLRVVSFKEEKLSWLTVIIREGFGRFILKTVSILYLSILFTKRNQHVVDLLTDTSVVLEKTVSAIDWYKSEHSLHLQ